MRSRECEARRRCAAECKGPGAAAEKCEGSRGRRPMAARLVAVGAAGLRTATEAEAAGRPTVSSPTTKGPVAAAALRSRRRLTRRPPPFPRLSCPSLPPGRETSALPCPPPPAAPRRRPPTPRLTRALGLPGTLVARRPLSSSAFRRLSDYHPPARREHPSTRPPSGSQASRKKRGEGISDRRPTGTRDEEETENRGEGWRCRRRRGVWSTSATQR